MTHIDPRAQLVPTVIENTNRGERGFDIYSRLLRERIVFIDKQIDDTLASLIVAQLLFLQSEDPDREVNLYIMSGGGSITAGLAIHDTMRELKCDIGTIAMGMVGSMATVLLAAGTKGKRVALPNSYIHFHPAGGQTGGYAPDVEIMVRWLLSQQERSNRLLAEYTGQTYERITNDFQRDRFFTAEEAIAYGLIDHILAEPDSEGAESAVGA